MVGGAMTPAVNIHESQALPKVSENQNGLVAAQKSSTKATPVAVSHYNFSSRSMYTSDKMQGASTQILYQSVPPRAGRGYLMDIYTPVSHTARRTPMGMSSPEFRCRTGTPSVVGLDSGTLPTLQQSKQHNGRGAKGFFPPVKLKSPTMELQDTKLTRGKRKLKLANSPLVLQLAPESPTSTPGGGSQQSQYSASHLKTHPRYYTYPPAYPHILPPAVQTVGDLTRLPLPKTMVSRGDVPWVYRYKVKKSMNELSKILASKPAPVVDYGYGYGQPLV